MAKIQSYYIGVKGIVQNESGEVLLLRDTQHDKWELPGGRVDENQTIKESFEREVKEELLGAKLEVLGQLVHAAQGDFLVENYHKLLLLFYLARVNLPNKIALSTEHDEFAWVNRADYVNYDMYETDRAAIQIVLESNIMSVIDKYLENVSPSQKTELQRIREIVEYTVPEAEKVISYGMPVFKYKKKYLLGFSAFKNHMSIFPGAHPVEANLKDLNNYKISKGTIQFTIDNPIPESIIKKLITVRLKDINNSAK